MLAVGPLGATARGRFGAPRVGGAWLSAVGPCGYGVAARCGWLAFGLGLPSRVLGVSNGAECTYAAARGLVGQRAFGLARLLLVYSTAVRGPKGSWPRPLGSWSREGTRFQRRRTRHRRCIRLCRDGVTRGRSLSACGVTGPEADGLPGRLGNWGFADQSPAVRGPSSRRPLAPGRVARHRAWQPRLRSANGVCHARRRRVPVTSPVLPHQGESPGPPRGAPGSFAPQPAATDPHPVQPKEENEDGPCPPHVVSRDVDIPPAIASAI